jgi:hypothetical protein
MAIIGPEFGEHADLVRDEAPKLSHGRDGREPRRGLLTDVPSDPKELVREWENAPVFGKAG